METVRWWDNIARFIIYKWRFKETWHLEIGGILWNEIKICRLKQKEARCLVRYIVYYTVTNGKSNSIAIYIGSNCALSKLFINYLMFNYYKIIVLMNG